MKASVAIKNEINATFFAALLILSIFTIARSLMQNKMVGIATPPAAFALQFPKSQQLDLMAVNSGSPPSIDNFQLPPGYKIEPVLWNLTTPGTMAFDDKGNIYLSEVGSSYGQLTSLPRIYKL